MRPRAKPAFAKRRHAEFPRKRKIGSAPKLCVDVELALDMKSRAVDVPDDLTKAFERNPEAQKYSKYFRDALGADFTAYRNHCHRVAGLCRVIIPGATLEAEKVAVAAAFHDRGIWTAKTWTISSPAPRRLENTSRLAAAASGSKRSPESIEYHHKVTPVSSRPALVERLRRADLADVSLGFLRSGLSSREVVMICSEFPNAGFHHRLVQLGCTGALRRPLKPLPMLRW